MWNPFARLGCWWRRRQRDIDRRILFPVMQAKATTPNQLAVAMLMHIGIDPAWRYSQEWKDEEPALYQALCENPYHAD